MNVVVISATANTWPAGEICCEHLKCAGIDKLSGAHPTPKVKRFRIHNLKVVELIIFRGLNNLLLCAIYDGDTDDLQGVKAFLIEFLDDSFASEID